MNTTGSLRILVPTLSIIQMDEKYFPHPWTKAQWENINPEHYQLFQFAQDDETIGFALFHLVPGDDVAHLLKILIVPEMRGEGFAPHLWTSTLQDLKNSGASSVYLEVAASNHRAIGFYEKCGFKQLRKSKAFYSDGEDALIMSMAL